MPQVWKKSAVKVPGRFGCLMLYILCLSQMLSGCFLTEVLPTGTQKKTGGGGKPAVEEPPPKKPGRES